MYAVIRTGGKQYKVAPGDVIDVERLANATVTATVVAQHRGKKVLVYTYKNKSGQQRHQGHRQSLTRLKVEGIELGAKRRAPRRQAREQEQES